MEYKELLEEFSDNEIIEFIPEKIKTNLLQQIANSNIGSVNFVNSMRDTYGIFHILLRAILLVMKDYESSYERYEEFIHVVQNTLNLMDSLKIKNTLAQYINLLIPDDEEIKKDKYRYVDDIMFAIFTKKLKNNLHIFNLLKEYTLDELGNIIIGYNNIC